MAHGSSLKLDHITVVARTLDEGSEFIRNALGVDIPEGGAHPRMGTHNRLMSLGSDVFLELIAIDPDAEEPRRPRWFNLDRFDGAPRLGTRVLGTNDIESALASAHQDSEQATQITRGDLEWLISVPDDGAMPMQGGFPTLIEWPPEPHPVSYMTDLDCRLKTLTIEHPEAEEIERLIGHRIDTGLIKITEGTKLKIKASIQTPFGERELT